MDISFCLISSHSPLFIFHCQDTVSSVITSNESMNTLLDFMRADNVSLQTQAVGAIANLAIQGLVLLIIILIKKKKNYT